MLRGKVAVVASLMLGFCVGSLAIAASPPTEANATQTPNTVQDAAVQEPNAVQESNSAQEPDTAQESNVSAEDPLSSDNNDTIKSAPALDFSFIKNPPGQLVSLGAYRLHVNCLGESDVTVLFDAGLGGNALEWQPIQRRLAQRATACTYDRAGYAWSDPSPYPRYARQLAHEADAMLDALQVDGPLILVGHSFGGFVMRHLSTLRDADMIGLVLVDSSHEDQFDRLETPGSKSGMPRGSNFVISAIDVPENLPEETRRKIAAFSRMRKTYSAIHSEMAHFRRSAEQLKISRQRVDYPIRVLRRGRDVFPVGDALGGQKNATWQALQEDLATISSRGSVTVADNSGHHIHVDEPELVAAAIEEILDEYESH